MKKRRSVMPAFAVVLVALLLASGASIAAGAPPAGAAPFPTLEQVQAAIAEAVAPIMTTLTDVGSRLTATETALTAQDARIAALEAAGGGGGGTSGLGPVTDFDVNVRIAAYANEWQPDLYWHVQPMISTSVPAGTIPGVDGAVTGVPTEAVIICTMGGITQANLAQGGYGPTVSQSSGIPKLAPGDPVQVEYWVEQYGIQKHGTVTITDWTYGFGF